MTDEFADRTLEEHQRVFDKIWTQNPDRQNRTSSSWWFFILFPEGDEGYGPRQLMFSIAAAVGDRCRVNGLPAPGMDLDRDIEDGKDSFRVATVGWAGDGEKLHDHIVKQPAEAVMSQDDQYIKAWQELADGRKHGSEFSAAEDRELGLEAHIVGDEVDAQFEAWGDLDCRMTSPDHSKNIDTPLGGVDLVAWRQLQFEGEFDLPDGKETLSGSCYFQRVCMDIPLFPWKWIWAIFPDGTAFSVMIPFVGPQLFRRGYKFFSSNTLERMTIPMNSSGFWHWGNGDGMTRFDSISVEPKLHNGEHPDFEVCVENENGDYVTFDARTYGHARNWLERLKLGTITDSHWSYNEFMFRMGGLDGQIDGKPINNETMGQGFGTLEYSTGMSF